jgi:hypothetical protein
LSVRFRRFLACSAAVCWATAIAIASSAPGHVITRYYALIVAIAITLTTGAWIGMAISPLAASQAAGIRAGARAGRTQGTNGGRHERTQKNVDDDTKGSVVVPLPRRSMRAADWR